VAHSLFHFTGGVAASQIRTIPTAVLRPPPGRDVSCRLTKPSPGAKQTAARPGSQQLGVGRVFLGDALTLL
jgi:hypothetical protein